MLDWLKRKNESAVMLAKVHALAQQNPQLGAVVSQIPRGERGRLASTAEGRLVLGALIVWASKAGPSPESPADAAAILVHPWHLWVSTPSSWCSLCGAPETSPAPVEGNLEERIDALAGVPYAELVRGALRGSFAEITAASTGIHMRLPTRARQLVEKLIDECSEQAYDPQFWRKDSAEVAQSVTDAALAGLLSAQVSPDSAMLFDVFESVTLSFAYSAWDQPSMRQFIGIA